MNNLIKKEIIEKFKKYNFQKYPFVFTDVNYKNLINWNDLNKLLEKDILHYPREGANKQVISSQADSLIKISRIWADFFPVNTSNQPI